MNKWGKITNNPLAQALLCNEIDHFSDQMLPSIEGPYYCDDSGNFITVEDAADPNYDPYILFRQLEDGKTFIYHLESESYYRKISIPEEGLPEIGIILVKPEEILDHIKTILFRKEPTIYNHKFGSFTKFAFPLIRKVFPNIISNKIVNVQPMTGPIGGISFYNPIYAKTHKKPV